MRTSGVVTTLEVQTLLDVLYTEKTGKDDISPGFATDSLIVAIFTLCTMLDEGLKESQSGRYVLSSV